MSQDLDVLLSVVRRLERRVTDLESASHAAGVPSVVAHFERELQRERDRALAAQSSERSARELVVELEAKLRAFESCSQPMLVPRSTDAIKEAIRLVTGSRPQVSNPEPTSAWWYTRSLETDVQNDARVALLKLLETLQPAETERARLEHDAPGGRP